MASLEEERATYSSKFPIVNMIELPLKKTIITGEMCSQNPAEDHCLRGENSEKSYTPQGTTAQYDHEEDTFCVNCICKNCLNYRETILQLIIDYFKTRSMWEILRQTMKNFFKPILEQSSNKVQEAYKKLSDEERRYWIVNGVMNQAKLHHMDFIAEFYPSESMVFTLFSTLLSVDDSHQLLELMAYEVECFVKAYAEGLSELMNISEENLTAEEIITYVLNGYDALCNVAENTGSLLFTFEKNHLVQFSLTWIELNKRIYQKYVYSKFIDMMPKCIIALKNQVQPDEYSALVKRYIKFDEEMMSINKKWKNIWLSLNKYHTNEKEQERRKRIEIIADTFEKIRNDASILFKEFIDIPEWQYCTNRQLVWENVVVYVNQRWKYNEKVDTNAYSTKDSCCQCHRPLEYHNINCECITCLIAGGPSLSSLCSNCVVLDHKDEDNYMQRILTKCNSKDFIDVDHIKSFENKVEETALRGEDVKQNNETTKSNQNSTDQYHISWIFFKHIKGRKRYPHDKIDENFFCSNCSNVPCMLAKEILNNNVNITFAEKLMYHYQPFPLPEEERKRIINSVMLYINKMISMETLIYDVPNEDIIIKTLWIFILSAFASYWASDPTSHTEEEQNAKLQIDNLRIIENDIMFWTELLNKNVVSNEALNCVEKINRISSLRQYISGNIQPSKSVNAEEKVKINISSPPAVSSPEKTVPLVEAPVNTTKEIKTSVKNVEIDPPIVQTAKTPKEQIFGKSCFHEKECSHTRINGTRDRLRRKLSELTNCKKSSATNRTNLAQVNSHHDNKENGKKENTDVKSETVCVPKQKPNKQRENIVKTAVKTKSDEAINDNTNDTNLDDWIKDKLSFIEGYVPKKGLPPGDSKKAAKKAKQKQRKEEQKKVEELQDLKSQFHFLYCKEFIAKMELKQQHTSKKKEKKKITDLEVNIKKLSKAKAKIERNILELISEVKSANTEFKFSYLPTKEQQEQMLLDMQPKESNTKQMPTDRVLHMDTELNHSSNHVLASNVQKNLELVKSKITERTRNTEPIKNKKVEIPMDSEKRMVTIRRVTLPHISETQVTVTAKGACPGNDKLLYTFINGQLVPAASLDSKSLNVLQSNYIPDQRLSNVRVQRNEEQQRFQQNCDFPVDIQKEVPIVSKKKRSKKHTERSEIQTNVVEKNKATGTIKGSKSAQKSKENKSQSVTAVEYLKPKPASVDTKFSNKQNQNQNCDFSQNVRQNVKFKNEPIRKEKVCEDFIEVGSEQIINKIVDNGQFDNNQFKMLHIDELSSMAHNHQTEKSMLDTRRNHKNSKFISNQDVSLADYYQDHMPINHHIIPSNTEDNSHNISCKYPNEINRLDKNLLTTIENHNDEITNSNLFDLNNSMQKLQIGTNTTLHFSKNGNDLRQSQASLNVSIMEQLNRGVQVEDLTLPPGITLTKVDPSKAEALRAKRESIEKLSQPLKQQKCRHDHSPVAPTVLTPYGRFEQNGVIMVNAMSAFKNMQDANKTKKSKNKRKNKKKKQQAASPDEQTMPSNMITLRNPMFHAPGISGIPLQLQNQMPLAPLTMDKPADIIKNDNGMFTIRNPILHPTYPTHPCNPKFCGNMESNNKSHFSQEEKNPGHNNEVNDGSKYISAIGSEVKYAQQQKQMINQWSRNQNVWQENAPHDYLNGINTSSQNHYDSCKQGWTNCTNTHSCDESPPLSFDGFRNFLDGVPTSKYNDLSFLNNFISGQNLNSEVTIHNVTESRFYRNQISSQGIEITPVPIPSTTEQSDLINQKIQSELPNYFFKTSSNMYKGSKPTSLY